MTQNKNRRDFKKQRLVGSELSRKVDRKRQDQSGRYEINFPNYKALATTVTLVKGTPRQQTIGFLLLAMMVGAGVAEIGNIMGVNNDVGKTKQPKPSDFGEDQVAKFDYKALEKPLLTTAREYGITEETLEATKGFLAQNPAIDLAKLAGDTADFITRSDGLASNGDIGNFLGKAIMLTAVAATARDPLKHSLSSLAIAALPTFLPMATAKQIDDINNDLRRIEESAEKVGIFQRVKSMFSYLSGLVPEYHEVPRNYKENQYLMNFLKAVISKGSISETADYVRMYLANESYLNALALLEAISESYHLNSSPEKDTQIVARAIFSEISEGFDHNFFHLLGVPLVQEKEATINYELLLLGTRDFLLKSGLPIKEALGQDKEGNNPLHILAAVGTLNQFKLFFKIFGGLIPKDILEQKNKHGHSPLDILGSDKVQKEAIDYVSKTMSKNFLIHTSTKSPSDMLHEPGSSAVRFDKDVLPITLKGRRMMFPSFPKSAYFQKPDGNYEIRDLLNDKPLKMINGYPLEPMSAKEYDRIKDKLPEGTSYAVLAFNSRKEKLQLVTEIVTEKKSAPKSRVKSTTATTLSPDQTKSAKIDL